MRTCRQDPDINARQINVIHVHSLGGGTGSGTFPLIAHMLNQITDDLSGAAGGMDIFTAGVGVVPEASTIWTRRILLVTTDTTRTPTPLSGTSKKL